jgi:hypothetical protein
MLAQGALLATEIDVPTLPELMTLRRFEFHGPVTGVLVEKYKEAVLGGLTKQGIPARVDTKQLFKYALTDELCGKLTIHRMSAVDNRVEVRYLLRDRVKTPWELVYLVRVAELQRWTPLFAEIEGQPSEQL